MGLLQPLWYCYKPHVDLLDTWVTSHTWTCHVAMLQAMDLFDIAEGYPSMEAGLERVTCPVMVIGVQTDVLFPIWQQRELATALQKSGHCHLENLFLVLGNLQSKTVCAEPVEDHCVGWGLLGCMLCSLSWGRSLCGGLLGCVLCSVSWGRPLCGGLLGCMLCSVSWGTVRCNGACVHAFSDVLKLVCT